MSGTPFQIPGLGEARPNEQLPAEHFAPDLIAAAASIMGENQVAVGPTNGNAQLEQRRQEKQQQQGEGAPKASTATDIADGMELDTRGSSTLVANSVEKQEQDIKMEDQEHKRQEGQVGDVEMGNNDAPSPDLTHALEAALGGMFPQLAEPAAPAQHQDGGNTEQQQDGVNAGQEDEHPEWEADSSPYESSSESSSSDSDSDDDSEDEGGYQLLGIEETARLLMAADGEGDGDGTGKGKGPGAALRTKNEIPEEVIPKPDVTITPEMKIEPLGNIEFVVETTIVIKSQVPGEVQVLDSGSVLCKEDRTVIGALAEVLGNVRSPMYTVGFSSEDDIKEFGLVTGTPIYYSVDHANYVFTQPLKEAKGTDASNLHDEEVPAEEMEFSDDEKEAEYKRQQKLKRRGGKAGRGGREQNPAASHDTSSHQAPGAALNYDDDEDGPYKPLTRPPGFGQAGPPSHIPLPPKPETGFSPPRGGRGHGHRGAHRGGRGDFRGRNQRGGYRGGDRRHGSRGGGSGSYPQFGRDGADSPQTGFQNLPPPPPQNPHLPPPPFGAKPPAPAGQWPAPPANFVPPPLPYSHSPPAQPQIPIPHHQPPTGSFNFNYQAWNQSQGQQYQYPQAAPHHQSPSPQQAPHATGYAQPFVPPQAPAWPTAGAVPQPPAAGAYNPTFFGGYQQPQQAPQGQQYWPQQHQQQQQHGAHGQGRNQ